MNEKFEFLSNLPHTQLIHSLIIIIVSFIIYEIIVRFVDKSTKFKTLNKRLSNKSKTYLKMMHNILRYVFVILTVLLLLQINGIDVSSMLAGVGIASVIIGLAVQDALKDIIRGFSLLSEEYFSVGDVVTYKDITGKVLALGLKTTKIKDISTENIISIANRNIEQIEIVSPSLLVSFPMPYEVPLQRAETVIKEILNHIEKIEDIESVKYLGVNELADSSVKYLIKIICTPEKRLQIKRDSLNCILKTLAKNKIEVPYNKLDVYQK